MKEAFLALEKCPFDPEQAPKYYTELSSILYQAIQRRIGRNIQQLTTEELLQAMQENGIVKENRLFSSNEIEKTDSLLTKIDQVKFGAKKGKLNEWNDTLLIARQLIDSLISYTQIILNSVHQLFPLALRQVEC